MSAPDYASSTSELSCFSEGVHRSSLSSAAHRVSVCRADSQPKRGQIFCPHMEGPTLGFQEEVPTPRRLVSFNY
jgi:hypothetical protein